MDGIVYTATLDIVYMISNLCHMGDYIHCNTYPNYIKDHHGASNIADFGKTIYQIPVNKSIKLYSQ